MSQQSVDDITKARNMLQLRWSSYGHSLTQKKSATATKSISTGGHGRNRPEDFEIEVSQCNTTFTCERDREIEEERRRNDLRRDLIRKLVTNRRRAVGPTSHLHVLRNPTPENVRFRMRTDTYHSPGLHNSSDTYIRYLKSEFWKYHEKNDASWDRKTEVERRAHEDWCQRVLANGQSMLELSSNRQREKRIEVIVKRCNKISEERMSEYIFNKDGSIRGLRCNEMQDLLKKSQHVRASRNAEGQDHLFRGVSTSNESYRSESAYAYSIANSAQQNTFDDSDESDEDEDDEWGHIYGHEDRPMRSQPKLESEQSSIMVSIERDQDNSRASPPKRSFEESSLYEDDHDNSSEVSQSSTNSLTFSDHYPAGHIDVNGNDTTREAAPGPHFTSTTGSNPKHSPKKRRLAQWVSEAVSSPIVASDSTNALDNPVFLQDIANESFTVGEIPGLRFLGKFMGGNSGSRVMNSSTSKNDLSSTMSTEMIDPILLQLDNPLLPALSSKDRLLSHMDNTINSLPIQAVSKISKHPSIMQNPQTMYHNIPQTSHNLSKSEIVKEIQDERMKMEKEIWDTWMEALDEDNEDDDLADVVDLEFEAEKEAWVRGLGFGGPRKVKGDEAAMWRKVRNEVWQKLDYGIGVFRFDPTGETWRWP